MLKNQNPKKDGAVSGGGDLEVAIRAVHQRLTDVIIRDRALRSLLVDRGLFSDDEFEQRVKELREKWERKLATLASAHAEDQALEQMRLLLESFEGTK